MRHLYLAFLQFNIQHKSFSGWRIFRLVYGAFNSKFNIEMLEFHSFCGFPSINRKHYCFASVIAFFCLSRLKEIELLNLNGRSTIFTENFCSMIFIWSLALYTELHRMKITQIIRCLWVFKYEKMRNLLLFLF